MLIIYNYNYEQQKSKLNYQLSIINYPLEYVSVGKIASVYGLKGEVILQHVLGKKSDLKGVKAFFTQDKEDSWFPWFIKEAKVKSSNQTYLLAEEIDTPEKAKKLVQKTVWLTRKDFEEQAAAGSALSLVGYTVVHEKKKLGEIVEVIEQPHQLLCTIIINGKEAFIPLHQESLLKVDRTRKYVFVDLPEGLLELYL